MKIADMHGDTIYRILKERRNGAEVSLCENNLHMDLHKMKKADYLLQNFALFVDLEECEDPYKPWQTDGQCVYKCGHSRMLHTPQAAQKSL